jgi:hypothetical protein
VKKYLLLAMIASALLAPLRLLANDSGFVVKVLQNTKSTNANPPTTLLLLIHNAFEFWLSVPLRIGLVPNALLRSQRGPEPIVVDRCCCLYC